jgi:hypothetical protein
MADFHGTPEGLMVALRSEAWASTRPVREGLDRDEYAKDRLGNIIRWQDADDRGSPFGWHVASWCGRGLRRAAGDRTRITRIVTRLHSSP